MDLTGKVIAILQANSGVSARTGNPWMSQEYVIEVPGQYPRKMLFRIFGEDQIKQTYKILRAAGDTYAVALASSALTLFRLLLMRGNARRRR